MRREKNMSMSVISLGDVPIPLKVKRWTVQMNSILPLPFSYLRKRLQVNASQGHTFVIKAFLLS